MLEPVNTGKQNIQQKKSNNVKTKTNKLILGVLAIAALGFNSCKKENPPVTNTDSQQAKLAIYTKTAQKQAITAQMFYKIGAEILPEMIADTRMYMKTRDWDCAVITVDSTVYPHVANIDFGGGCTDSKGRTFSGSIDISYTDSDLGNPGCVINATFNSFVMDSIQLDGTMNYRNDGPNGSGNEVGSLTFNTTSNFTMDFIRLNGVTTLSFVCVQARNTAFIDVNSNATDAYGTTYTTTTTTQLEQREGCEFYPKGVLRSEER